MIHPDYWFQREVVIIVVGKDQNIVIIQNEVHHTSNRVTIHVDSPSFLV